ncbi:MAG: hypothetical protein MOB07_18630 [Acidobacteria bacterium]|nr:hypothetical protein [Acidobacteriota bacterium]
MDEKSGNPKLTDWMPWLQKQPWFIPSDENFADNFPLAVEHLLRPAEFRREFFTEMIKPPNGINAGYRSLARIILRRLCWSVLTANFDHNIVEALREQRPHIPDIVEINRTADDLIRFSIYNHCQIVYLHGAVEFYRDKNLAEDIQSLDKGLVKLVWPVLRDSPLVVVGYRGSEPSIAKHLLEAGIRETNGYRHGIYWCLLKGERPHENVIHLQHLLGSNFRLLEIDGFDELMEALDRELEQEIWLPGNSDPVSARNLADLSYDHRPIEDVKLADLDHDLILTTLASYCRQLKISQVRQENYLAWMQEQGLLVKEENVYKPTIGCYLLFGREVSERFPYARVGITTSGKKRQVFEGNLIEQFRKIEAHLTSEEINPLLRVKGERSANEKPAYPPRALTELIVNLLVHRDYEKAEYSHIEFEPGQSLRFNNPGGLLPRVYRQMNVDRKGRFLPVRHASDVRNKSLADIFWGLGVMDKDGSGLVDVRELMAENGGSSEFSITNENDSVSVTLLQPRQASPGRSRVARRISSVETYLTNLLPFSLLPQTIYRLPLRPKPLEPLLLFEQDESPKDFPTFIETGGHWLSFANWDSYPTFADRHGYLENATPEDLSAYVSDEDQRRHFVWLIGKHWEFYLRRFFDQGLAVERKRKRAFFHLVKGERNTVIYNSRLRKGVKRDVVKRRGDEDRIWHENEGIAWAVVGFGGSWALQLKPFYMFTRRDGCTPLPPFIRTQRATRRMKFDRNKNVDDDLSFWARLLAAEQPTINIGGVGVENLILDAEYCSAEVPLLNQGEH